MNRPARQRIIRFLSGGLVLIFLSLGGFLYFTRSVMEIPEIENIHIDSKAALKLDGMEQVSKKNGITEWELKAASATLLREENKAVLKAVNVTFYTRDNKKVFLYSDKGILNTKTRDMTFLENVLVRHETYVLKTDKLHYEKKTHIIRSDVRVTLEDHASVITADSMVTELNKNRVTFKGHVKGNFSENSQIP